MKLIEHGTAQRLVVAPGLLICAYTWVPVLADTQAIRTAIATEPELQSGYHLLVFVDGGSIAQAVQLDADVRSAFTDIMRTAPLWSAGYVIALSGFTGVAIRAVFTSFMLLGRKRPERVFATVNDAISWTSSLPQADRSTLERAAEMASPTLWAAGTTSTPSVSKPR